MPGLDHQILVGKVQQGQRLADRCAFIDILPRKALRFW